ncbi:MAG: ribonuclease J [Clostridia bacterium]|nr:ribonuclease J [Clostridia bacterium]
MTRKEQKLKVIPLGGLDQIGKNFTVFEYGNDIIVVDAGMAFPDDEMLGVDVVIPDMTYLKKNFEKVRAIFVTHGHEDHIGAIPYLLREINVPVYGTKLTLGLIDVKLKEHKLGKVKMNVKKPGDVVKIGGFTMELIRVNHSIPDAVAYAIKTPAATVVHTGDFKVDFTPIDGEPIDLARFAELGKEGVDLLLSDSTNVKRPGFTMSESTVGETFEEIFRHAESRIIIASFASNVDRVQQIVNAAYMNGRKVAFSGRSMVNVTQVAVENGYLKIPEGLLIDTRDVDRYPENEICIVTTGSQGEPMSALARMSKSEHRQLQIHDGDLVILSSSPIPGNEKSVTKVINNLMMRGANVIYQSLADVHVSGHACQEELKLMLSLVKPKNFMPVHGEYSFLKTHGELASQLGMDQNHIFIMENGHVLEVSQSGAKLGKPVPSGQIMVDGLGVGDVGNIVLRDRKRLSEDGLIIIVITLSKDTGKVVSGPDIVSRGFVYVRESEELMNGARIVVEKALEKLMEKEVREWSSIKNEVKDSLKDYLYQNTKRNPMILPIITEA